MVISVGGSIAVSGVRDDGKPWKIGVRNPFGNQNDYFAKLVISDSLAFISTSGSYEKQFEKDGKKYHHILDLTTGYPVDTDLVSVTVKADSGFLSDALSTLCFVLGENESLPILEKYNAEAVFVYADKTVSATDGISDSLEIVDGEFKLK
jgi:thiamine biosynthesis lipoprotein